MPSYYLCFLFSSIVLLYEANASSVCMADCTTGYCTPSLYHQYCCLSANNGKALKMNESNSYTYIFCPTAGLPKALCYSFGLIKFHTCSEVLENIPNAASGYYNISQSNGSIVSVYCDMKGNNCDGNGGWMGIGYINMTEPGATCLQGLYSYTYGNKTLCDKRRYLGGGCNSTFFSANGLNYTKVCGQARGYQFGGPDGFFPNYGGGSEEIEGVYVDGLSITHGSNPRIHIWTYANGVNRDHTGISSCPCDPVVLILRLLDHHMLVMITTVNQEQHPQISGLIHFILMTYCGMVSNVVHVSLLVAPVLQSPGLLKPYLSQLLMILN
uniref:Fibrinogen C-terminal domain-containing protein n=1 Tax=Amphimedon queenslandica TaxID=400682 RepID=A0A1X7T1A8_AMPQE